MKMKTISYISFMYVGEYHTLSYYKTAVPQVVVKIHVFHGRSDCLQAYENIKNNNQSVTMDPVKVLLESTVTNFYLILHSWTF